MLRTNPSRGAKRRSAAVPYTVLTSFFIRSSSQGKLGEEYTNPVPDIYLRNQELDEQVVTMRKEMEKMKAIAEKARGTWDNFRKQRDFHRMHHKRVVQEKDKLTNDLKHLHKHYLSYEPTLKELQAKYQVAMKEKMLMR